MKPLKKILFFISNILTIPLIILMSIGMLWYILPDLSTIIIGQFILNILKSENVIFWLTIISSSLFLILFLLQLIFGKELNAKFKNFFIHTNSWLIGLLFIGICISTFILKEPLLTNTIVINMVRKIGIGVLIFLLLIHHLFSSKIFKMINRKIQSYDNAKESNIVGRSSILFINILKLIEILYPELLILGLLCYCLSWNIATYLIIIIIGTFIPVIGNIISDINTRKEIRIKIKKEKDSDIERIAEKIKGI